MKRTQRAQQPRVPRIEKRYSASRQCPTEERQHCQLPLLDSPTRKVDIRAVEKGETESQGDRPEEEKALSESGSAEATAHGAECTRLELPFFTT